MRKIISHEQRERKKRRNQIVIGIVLIVLMIFSTAGFAFVNQGSTGNNEVDELQTLTINGVVFTGYGFGNDWTFQTQGSSFITRNLPTDVDNIQFSTTNTVGKFVNKPLYFVGNGPGVSELARNLQNLASRVQNACIKGEECENLPIKDCNDNVIIVKEPVDDIELIYEEDNCVYIISELNNQIRHADRYLFSLLNL
jgi:hypothetical protein